MSSLSKTFVLRTEANTAALWNFLKQNARAMAEAGKPLAVTINQNRDKRTDEQNRLFHALLNEISEHAWVNGNQYSPDVWKEMIRRRFIGTEELSLPDGTRIERGLSTTTLSIEEFSKLIDVVSAWATTELGVEL